MQTTVLPWCFPLDLNAAMSSRRLGQLEAVLKEAEQAGLQAKLKLQLDMAQRIVEQLRRLEKLRHQIMKLDQRTIAEIKSYATPPAAVHGVMKGTFLLLGNDERSLKVGEDRRIFVREGSSCRSMQFKVLLVLLRHEHSCGMAQYKSND